MKKQYRGLRPWKKGQSGNKSGSPLFHLTWEELYKLVLTKPKSYIEEELKKDLDAKSLIVLKDVMKAVKGDSYAVSRIQDRTEGKAVQRIINEDGTMDKIKKAANGDPVKAMALLKEELADRGLPVDTAIVFKEPSNET